MAKSARTTKSTSNQKSKTRKSSSTVAPSGRVRPLFELYPTWLVHSEFEWLQTDEAEGDVRNRYRTIVVGYWRGSGRVTITRVKFSASQRIGEAVNCRFTAIYAVAYESDLSEDSETGKATAEQLINYVAWPLFRTLFGATLSQSGFTMPLLPNNTAVIWGPDTPFHNPEAIEDDEAALPEIT